MFFHSIKEINRLRKGINRNVRNVKYLCISYYWERLTFLKLRFFKFKNFVSRSVFGELQPTQISSNFITSCCNLKIRGLRAKLFNYFNFERNCDVIKSKSSCILLNRNINFNKNETEPKMENSTHCFRETNLVLQRM